MYLICFSVVQRKEIMYIGNRIERSGDFLQNAQGYQSADRPSPNLSGDLNRCIFKEYYCLLYSFFSLHKYN